MVSHLNKGSLILFQGDSITDCNRHKLRSHDLGRGYVQLIQQRLDEQYSDQEFTCLNRGISGNRTLDVKLRWRMDCLNHAPDVLSLLVGINDTWRRYDSGLKTSIEHFEENYRYLLDTFKNKYPDTPILLLSPFLLPVSEEQEVWFEDLLPKIECVEKLAKEYDTAYLPLQKIFEDNLSSTCPPSFWTFEGVHPTPQGHLLIANAWMSLFESVCLDSN